MSKDDLFPKTSGDLGNSEPIKKTFWQNEIFEGTVGGIKRSKNCYWKNATSDHQNIGAADLAARIKIKIDEAKTTRQIEISALIFPEWFSDFDESNCKWGE